MGKKNIMAKYFTKLSYLVRPAPLKGTCSGLGNFYVLNDMFAAIVHNKRIFLFHEESKEHCFEQDIFQGQSCCRQGA